MQLIHLRPRQRAAHRALHQWRSLALAVRPSATAPARRLDCIYIEPGGILGTHPPGVEQLFLAVSGKGGSRASTVSAPRYQPGRRKCTNPGATQHDSHRHPSPRTLHDDNGWPDRRRVR